MLLMAWAQVRFSGESYLVDNYVSLNLPRMLALVIDLGSV